MTTAAQLDLLAVIAERSPEGLGVPQDTLRAAGGPGFDEDLAALVEEGLVRAVGDGDGGPLPDTVAITDEGRAVLQPRNPQ
jgi:chromosome segregation and condensation protein ScpB